MERRDRSLKALRELAYIDSLDADERAQGLERWSREYLPDEGINNFELELDDLKKMSELFHKNITFLKEHKENKREELLELQKVKKFLKH